MQLSLDQFKKIHTSEEVYHRFQGRQLEWLCYYDGKLIEAFESPRTFKRISPGQYIFWTGNQILEVNRFESGEWIVRECRCNGDYSDPVCSYSEARQIALSWE